MVRLHLKQSKTDHMGHRAHIKLWRTGLDLCPVAAVLRYVESSGAQSGPFFLDSRKEPVQKSTFIAEILENLDFPQHQYAGHSFRIGAATSAIEVVISVQEAGICVNEARVC